MRLAVVIPCFNYEAFIGEAIRSVLTNTRRPDEVIVVDDDSTDGSAEVVRSFADVRLIQQANTGMAGALNAGVAASAADVIVLLDADDTADPGRLAWIEEAFADPAVCLAWHPLRIVTLDGRERGLMPHAPLPRGDIADELASNGLPNFAVTSGIALRRDAFVRVGPIPEVDFRSAAEGFLVRTLPFIGLVATTDRPLGVYRSHPASYTRHMAGRDYDAIENKLRRRLDDADNEHDVLAASATGSGRPLTTARLRAIDDVYLALYRQYTRLTSTTRRSAWRRGRTLELDHPRRRRVSTIAATLALVAYCLAPKRLVASWFLIRGDYERSGLLELEAKLYWRIRRAGLVARSQIVHTRTRTRTRDGGQRGGGSNRPGPV